MIIFRILGAGSSVFFQFMAIILSVYLIALIVTREAQNYKEGDWGNSKRSFLLRPPVLRSMMMITLTLFMLGICIYGASEMFKLFMTRKPWPTPL